MTRTSTGRVGPQEPSGGDQPFYLSRATIRRSGGPDKCVKLPAEAQEVVMGAHSEIAVHLGVDGAHPPRAATLDYIVGATAACLAGTFARALAARGVQVGLDDYRVEGTGEVFERSKVLVLERILVRHILRAPVEHHAEVRKVHEFYDRACPVSRSLERSIEIGSELDLSEGRHSSG